MRKEKQKISFDVDGKLLNEVQPFLNRIPIFLLTGVLLLYCLSQNTEGLLSFQGIISLTGIIASSMGIGLSVGITVGYVSKNLNRKNNSEKIDEDSPEKP